MKKGRMPLFPTLFFDWIYQQRRVFTQPRGPQVERHRHGTLVTGEVALAALLITPAFTGAADVADAPANPIAMVAIAATTIIRILTSCRWSSVRASLMWPCGLLWGRVEIITVPFDQAEGTENCLHNWVSHRR
jgi:hypothetical protein